MADSKDTAQQKTQRKTLDELLTWTRNKATAAGTAGADPQAQEKPQPKMQLPLWPEPVRAVPNGFLRSALFGAIAKGKRRYIDGERLAALDGIEISYTGQRLDQGDLDVWGVVSEFVSQSTLCRFCGRGGLNLPVPILTLLGQRRSPVGLMCSHRQRRQVLKQMTRHCQLAKERPRLS